MSATPPLRASLGLACVLIVATTALATAPDLEVSLQPQRFGVDDVVQLTVRVTEPPSDLRAPSLGALDNLEIVAGPSTGSEFSFVNGVASRAQTFTYLLRALAPGVASLGPVTVVAGGVELRSDAITAEVVEGSIAPPPRRGRRSPFLTDPFADLIPRRAPPRAELALRHVLGARQATVGQPLVATVFLDSTVSTIDRFDWQTAPAYPGFWAQRVENPEQVMPELVEVDGTRFHRYPILRTVLVPLKTGSLEIPAVAASIGVRPWSVFDSPQLVERSTPPRTVQVVERPPAPAGFSGAVGELRYRATLEPVAIEFGESAVLTVTLEGRGNLPLVEAPALWPSCTGCDVYPPEESSAVTVDEGGIHGSRTWQMTVVPREWGEIELESVDLAVFDPSTGRYLTQTIGPLTFTVAAPPPTATPVVTPAPVVDSEVSDDASAASPSRVPTWAWIGGALVLGLLLGGSVTWVLTRRRRGALPARRADQSPAERARELHLTLERWWMDARSSSRGAALEDEMQRLRRDLEAVRFAPGRADHTETVIDLEARLKRLMRRA